MTVRSRRVFVRGFGHKDPYQTLLGWIRESMSIVPDALASLDDDEEREYLRNDLQGSLRDFFKAIRNSNLPLAMLHLMEWERNIGWLMSQAWQEEWQQAEAQINRMLANRSRALPMADIERVLMKTDGNVEQAADLLGITRQGLYKRLRAAGLHPKQRKSL